jgi:hypothetical protein
MPYKKRRGKTRRRTLRRRRITRRAHRGGGSLPNHPWQVTVDSVKEPGEIDSLPTPMAAERRTDVGPDAPAI